MSDIIEPVVPPVLPTPDTGGGKPPDEA